MVRKDLVKDQKWLEKIQIKNWNGYRVIRDDELTTADQSGCQHAGVEKDDGSTGSTGHSASCRLMEQSVNPGLGQNIDIRI